MLLTANRTQKKELNYFSKLKDEVLQELRNKDPFLKKEPDLICVQRMYRQGEEMEVVEWPKVKLVLLAGETALKGDCFEVVACFVIAVVKRLLICHP